jgi:hypothetical protein
MKTLETETDIELNKVLQEHQRKERRKPKPTYHPIGLVTEEQLLEYQNGCYEMLRELEPTFYTTFVFQRKFSNQNIEQQIKHLKEKLSKFNKYIHRKLLGRYWYDPEIVNPQEHIKICVFPEKINSHPHFCGIVEIKNSQRFPNKIKMFLEHSTPIWNTNKQLSTGDRDVLVPNGYIRIEKPRDVEDVCWYSVKEQKQKKYYGHYYTNGKGCI